jgi:hypothetical protein
MNAHSKISEKTYAGVPVAESAQPAPSWSEFRDGYEAAKDAWLQAHADEVAIDDQEPKLERQTAPFDPILTVQGSFPHTVVIDGELITPSPVTLKTTAEVLDHHGGDAIAAEPMLAALAQHDRDQKALDKACGYSAWQRRMKKAKKLLEMADDAFDDARLRLLAYPTIRSEALEVKLKVFEGRWYNDGLQEALSVIRSFYDVMKPVFEPAADLAPPAAKVAVDDEEEIQSFDARETQVKLAALGCRMTRRAVEFEGEPHPVAVAILHDLTDAERFQLATLDGECPWLIIPQARIDASDDPDWAKLMQTFHDTYAVWDKTSDAIDLTDDERDAISDEEWDALVEADEAANVARWAAQDAILDYPVRTARSLADKLGLQYALYEQWRREDIWLDAPQIAAGLLADEITSGGSQALIARMFLDAEHLAEVAA